MKLAFQIGWRFLLSSKGQTVLICLGIAIGVAVQVFIGTLITGLQQSLLDSTIGSSPHITVEPKENDARIADYQSILDDIRRRPDVTQSTAVADAAGFIEWEGETSAVLFRGLDFETADGIYKIQTALLEGSMPVADEIILGRELMEDTGLVLGDSVSMLTPTGATHTVRISGVYDLGVTSLNTSWAVAQRELVQQVFAYGDEATAIEIQVADVFGADALAGDIQERLPDGLVTLNWKEQNASLLSGLNGQSVSSYMIQAFVLLSVILGIASVLIITVLQKSRQLGILKAMGIKNGTASLIFLSEGFVLGLFGAVLGVGLGLGLSVLFTKFALGPDGNPLIPLTINPWFVLFSGLVALAAAMLASLIPAYRSSRLDPIEVIQNG